MKERIARALRGILVLGVALCLASIDTAALAQARNCNELNANLDALNRNRAYRALDANINRARQMARDLQDMQSTFVRGGCQDQLNAGGQLNRACRTLANRIINTRNQYQALTPNIQTGQAVAQQREVTLQQIARFNCDVRSSAGFTRSDRQSQGRGNFLTQMFGGPGQVIDEYGGFGFAYPNQSTLRTVCVRTCDGYYWPVSFSTIDRFLARDSNICQAQCKGQPVELYYYANPGQTPESMVNLRGHPYTQLPNAFLYRSKVESDCTCQKRVDYGSVEFEKDANGGPTRAVISFKDRSFPMPRNDPRRKGNATVAQAVHVPLPRVRPARAGEKRLATVQHDAPVGSRTARRVVHVDGKRVRIVGPDTPYGRLAATGS